eukprot:2674208-Lingulodinium_polyedra.AAC.1
MTEGEEPAPPPPPPAPPDGGEHEASLPLRARTGQATGRRTKSWLVSLQPDTGRPAHCSMCKT